MSEDQRLVLLDTSFEVPTKFPRALGRQPINTMSGVKEEACRVYRAVASGKISPKLGNALIYQLSTIGKLIEAEKTDALEVVEDAMRAARTQAKRSQA